MTYKDLFKEYFIDIPLYAIGTLVLLYIAIKVSV